jgi:hypothetical protein
MGSGPELNSSDNSDCKSSDSATSRVVLNANFPNIDMASLRSWYAEYRTGELRDSCRRRAPVLAILDGDILDLDSIQKRVLSLASCMPTFDNFCDRCQIILDNWPVLRDLVDTSTLAENYQLVEWHSILYVEAAARKGCRFCSTMMRQLSNNDLHDLRCVETRLELLGVVTRPTISVWSDKIFSNLLGGAGPDLLGDANPSPHGWGANIVTLKPNGVTQAL